jgi:hypothetical protein
MALMGSHSGRLFLVAIRTPPPGRALQERAASSTPHEPEAAPSACLNKGQNTAEPPWRAGRNARRAASARFARVAPIEPERRGSNEPGDR